MSVICKQYYARILIQDFFFPGQDGGVIQEEWDSEDDVPLSQLFPKKAADNSFSDVLITPQQEEKRTPKRRKVLNYKAQEVKKDLFEKHSAETTTAPKKGRPEGRKKRREESWMCSVCGTDTALDMRKCESCEDWVHEECVGLTATDMEPFICPTCTS